MDQDSNNRIQRIINNLRSTTGLKGKLAPPQSLQDRLSHYNTPGISVAVINEFEVEWARGFGLCDVQSEDKVTVDTLFQAGSISKPIFALAVMRLVQKGLLSLDEDIHRYLSSWSLPANEGWQPEVNLRQILSHSAGLTVHGFPGYHASEALPTMPQILNGESPANTAKVEVNILPGMQFRYSGGGTTVAQQLVVDLLQKSFPQLMHELVFEPLGLRNSSYEQSLSEQWLERIATAHPWKGLPLNGKYHRYPEMAAAGLWTTATDLAQIGVELLKVLHDLKKPNLLTKETIESMLQPQLPHQKMGDGDYVGLGFFCGGADDGASFGHGGWDKGFVSSMRLYKNIGKGVVIMINSNEGNELIGEIIRAIAEEYDWPNAVPEEKTAVNLANIHDYVGLYSTDSGTQFQVSAVDDCLMLQYGKQRPLPIFPSSETEFFTKAVNTDILFDKDEKEGVVSLTISQDGSQMKAVRQAAAKPTVD